VWALFNLKAVEKKNSLSSAENQILLDRTLQSLYRLSYLLLVP
jgi:hypothetical protein